MRDFAADARRWDRAVTNALVEVAPGEPGSLLVHGLPGAAQQGTAPDWTGLPLRVVGCLGRAGALTLLDRPPAANGCSGRDFQEEYLEWRTVRAGGKVQLVELTAELPERWRLLAAHEPEILLELVARFARESVVAAAEVFGDYDPFAAYATPLGRELAFAAVMLGPGPRSPFNDGSRAICCMTQSTNTLPALAGLTIAALRPRVVEDGSAARRAPTAGELIPLLSAAQAGRGSDPVLVERLARLAFEGRSVGFGRPVGVWLQGVAHSRLRKPSGEPVPAAWFTFSRHLSAEGSAIEPGRAQRLSFAVPAGEGFCVGDVVDVATEQPIRFGGQIAELVQLAMPFTVGPGVGELAPPALTVTTHPDPGDDPLGHARLREDAERMLLASPAES